MLDQSSITFSTQRSLPSVFTLPNNHYDMLFSQFEGTINAINDGRGQELLLKLSNLLQRTRAAFEDLKTEKIEQKKKCLEHIEILLYQRDYHEALRKIDYYKNNPQVEASYEIQVSQFDPEPLETYRQHCPHYPFEEALKIVENINIPFEKRHQLWLNAMMTENDEQYELLHHIDYEDIENARLEAFKRQFSIKEQSQDKSEESITCLQLSCNMNTPKKKGNSKSMMCLKSEKKSNGKQKSNKVDKTKSPMTGKDNKMSAQKKSHEKKTVRKVGEKEGKDHKTCRKRDEQKVVPFVF